MNLGNRVGLFGGTFNPLHNAHLLVAERALQQYALSEVVFIPSGIPPHKQVEDGIDKEDRYEMVGQAITSNDRFSVSRIEIDREGPSYTIDTIRSLKRVYRQGVCFIVGADLLLQIETWKEPQELLTSVPFIIAPRDGVCKEAFLSPPLDRAEVHFLAMKEVDLSSSWVRERVKDGEAIQDWVPPVIAEYIEQHGFYQGSQLTQIRR